MTEIIENSRLMDLAIEKHRQFLSTFSNEFSELDRRLNAIKQESDAVRKEIQTAESRATVLAEKYHFLFYQGKKQREELFNAVFEKMRASKAAASHDIQRLGGRMEELEKKLQLSKNIEDEEKALVEIKKLLYDFESAARKAGIAVTCKGIVDKLNEANSSHRELLSIQDKPGERASSVKDFEKQTGELEGRYNWLKHRIESHNNALSYWEKQKGVIKV